MIPIPLTPAQEAAIAATIAGSLIRQLIDLGIEASSAKAFADEWAPASARWTAKLAAARKSGDLGAAATASRLLADLAATAIAENDDAKIVVLADGERTAEAILQTAMTLAIEVGVTMLLAI